MSTLMELQLSHLTFKMNYSRTKGRPRTGSINCKCYFFESNALVLDDVEHV